MKCRCRRTAFFDIQPRFFGLLTAPLVDQDLVGGAVGLGLVFDEVDLQLAPEKVRHRLLDELVGDGLFRLVFHRRSASKNSW